MRLTVNQINEFADSQKHLADLVLRVYKMIDRNIFESMQCGRKTRYNAIGRTIWAKNTNYAVEIDIDENSGHVVCFAYNADAVRKYCQELDDDRFDKDGKLIWPDEPKVEFTFPMPETRGYSDTPERSEVNIFSEFDVEFAINEFIDEKFGIQHLYKWELRQFFSPGELGLEEEEFDLLADSFCY